MRHCTDSQKPLHQQQAITQQGRQLGAVQERDVLWSEHVNLGLLHTSGMIVRITEEILDLRYGFTSVLVFYTFQHVCFVSQLRAEAQRLSPTGVRQCPTVSDRLSLCLFVFVKGINCSLLYSRYGTCEAQPP